MSRYKNKFGKEHNRSIKLLGSNGIIYYGYAEAGRVFRVHYSTISLSIIEDRPIRNGIKFSIIK